MRSTSFRKQQRLPGARAALLVAVAAAALGAPSPAWASGAVRGPAPVLGVDGQRLAVRAAQRLPDGSVIVAGARDGRAFAARVRPSGVLEERFGTRGLWQGARRSVASAVQVTSSAAGASSASATRVADVRIVVTVERPAGAPSRAVVLGADGRPRGGRVAADGTPRCGAQVDGDGLRLGRLASGAGAASNGAATPAAPAQLPAATGFSRPGDWTAASSFGLRGSACGALLASGRRRALVLQRGAGPGVAAHAVAAGAASQVAARCLGHVLVFGVTAASGRRQLIVQAVDLPAGKAAAGGRHGARATRATRSITGC